MKQNILLRTNIFICTVIILGFLLTSLVSYNANNGIYKNDIEHITTLTSEGIYHQIDSIFTKPINISQTMANDNLLKTFLMEERTRENDEDFIQTMREYLMAYKEKYNYDSVFLASTQTNRYYHFEQGVDRILTKENPENEWYYSFLQDGKEYEINIDNDEVQSANNEINIFINCKIFSTDGEIMGVVGVGFAVDTIQEMLYNYEKNFQIRANLVDENGMIEISTKNTGYVKKDFFKECAFASQQQAILSNFKSTESFWYSTGERKGYVTSKYISNMGWHLIIDSDTTVFEARLNRQFFVGVAIVILVTGIVLFVITSIIRKYNAQIVKLTVAKEKAHRTAFQEETEKLYENIHEIDITHNRAANEATESYFEGLGTSKKLPFDKALHEIAQQQIKVEFRDGYINTFSPNNVLQLYQEGTESLSYEMMISNDGGYTYYWIRITARIFFWEEDKSVRMLVYRQNIDSEKRREIVMAEKMQRDSLSGLYNKAATQELIRRLLAEHPERMYAFFILDIDDFKLVNDTFGHAMGDQVIADFAGKIKRQFRESDIVGRIGGDEFVVFVPIPSKEWLEKKVEALSQSLRYEFLQGDKSSSITSSIGVAISPEDGENFETLYQNADGALYQAKENGKNRYTFYEA